MAISSIQGQHWDSILSIQSHCYPQLPPESIKVLQSKWRASPEFCYVKTGPQEQVQAYLLCHYWPLEYLPKLAQLLPPVPVCEQLFLHDLAVAPEAQGTGAGKQLVEHLFRYCQSVNIKRISLIALPNAISFWQRFGFQASTSRLPCNSYGEGAKVMQLTF